MWLGRRSLRRRGGSGWSAVAPPVPQPQDGQDQVQDDLDEVGGPPRADEDGHGDDQRADRRANAVGAVQQVEEPCPAGQGDRRVGPASIMPAETPSGRPRPAPATARGQRGPGVAQRS